MGALDVREEEGDGAGRQLGPAHGAILSPCDESQPSAEKLYILLHELS